jgi:hypothetical protein
VIDVWFVGETLGDSVNDGAGGPGAATATDTAHPAAASTRTQSNATSGLRLALLTVLFANRVT